MCEKIVILDAGAQYGKVIDRRLRELFIETDFLPLNTSAKIILQNGYKGIIISGGPNSVYADNAPIYDKNIFLSGIPILGICYGMQMINSEFGGTVEKAQCREDGQFSIHLDNNSSIFRNLNSEETVLLTHGDCVKQIASQFRVTATCGQTIAAIANENLKIFGVQFHPEVDLTEKGLVILKNFAYTICGCKGSYSLGSRKEDCIAYIKETVGGKKVLMLVSGGVDSTVCCTLLRIALSPDQIIAIHIDNGFMRLGESKRVYELMTKIGIKLQVIDAAERFSNGCAIKRTGKTMSVQCLPLPLPLNAVVDPEEKRTIIGDTFMEVANDVISKLNLNFEDVFLAQGTLRPDLIESASEMASGKAEAIKTHHNDSYLVRILRQQGRVVEPLKDFHKDEVRVIAQELNLPSDLVHRHPFPGPGLAIRILCVDQLLFEKDIQEINMLLKTIIDFAKSCKKPQSLVTRIQGCLSEEALNGLKLITERGHLSLVLLPVKSVGVQGDCRSFSYVAALSSSEKPVWSELFFLAQIIPRICTSINRVVYIFGNPVSKSITEITPTMLTYRVIETLRHADHVTYQIMKEHDCLLKVSQMPVVLIPIHFDRYIQGQYMPSCQRSIVLRPFITSDFMTGIAAVPGVHLPETTIYKIVESIKTQVPGISRVLYDLTSKPPGTTEWE